jgi:hypothetical protein
MNTEQAIYELGGLPIETYKEAEAMSMAIAALRAQQEKERQKPCKYCKMDDLGFGANIVEGSCEDEGVYITNNPNGILSLVANYSGTDSADIFYCPMCGRKLETKEADHVQGT